MNKIIIISGPTASGKTALAVSLAKMLNTEVISCDSMQIYKNMDIGTAKVTIEEMDGVKHHMIDIVNPDMPYSVSDYSEKALQIISDLHNKNKIPIICGGTGLYIDSLLYPLSFVVNKDDNIRDALYKELDKYGPEHMHALLEDIDPKEAEKVHYNNTKRVIRALEIFKITGKTKSELDERERPLRYDSMLIALNPERELLYSRINDRVDKMFTNGLLNEVKSLVNNGISFDMQSMQAIGYKEFKPYFNDECSLDEVKENIKTGSRNYAKRQITWLKRYPFAKFYDMSELSKIYEEIDNFTKE